MSLTLQEAAELVALGLVLQNQNECLGCGLRAEGHCSYCAEPWCKPCALVSMAPGGHCAHGERCKYCKYHRESLEARGLCGPAQKAHLFSDFKLDGHAPVAARHNALLRAAAAGGWCKEARLEEGSEDSVLRTCTLERAHLGEHVFREESVGKPPSY